MTEKLDDQQETPSLLLLCAQIMNGEGVEANYTL